MAYLLANVAIVFMLTGLAASWALTARNEVRFERARIKRR